MIDLRRLAVLRAVAHYGTVTAAAKAVHMTASAASQQVRQLSRELDVTLLEPHGRRVRLTPAARSLLQHADRIEEYWQQAHADFHAASTTAIHGELRVAGFPSAAYCLLAPLAAQLQHKWPELTVEVREAEPRDCFDLLFSGDADLAVIEATLDSPPLTDTRFEQRALFDDPYDLLVHEGHPLASRSEVGLREVAREPWIVGAFPGSCHQLVVAACNRAGFTPSVAHRAQEWTLVAALVAHRLGVALIPRLAQLPPGLDVRRVPLCGRTAPLRRIVSVVRSGSQDHPALAQALALLDTLAAEQGQLVD